MRVSGDGPAYHRPPGSRIILYRRADLDVTAGGVSEAIPTSVE
jgi:hypothetical protein